MVVAARRNPERAPLETRAELTLGRIGQAWQTQPHGRRYTEQLVDFLRARHNPNTLRSYTYALLEFFGWYELERRWLPTPDQIRRADAVDYDRWLRTRKYGLREYYLLHDPTRRPDAAIYVVVRERPGATLELIHAALGHRIEFSRWTVDDFAHRLACLVETKTLVRSPSLLEIRSGKVDVGLPAEQAARVGLGVPVPAHVFRYDVPADNKPAAERASTVAQRLSALSSFWTHMMRAGENTGPEAPLLRVNVWLEPLKVVSRQVGPAQKDARMRTTTTGPLLERVLSATFVHRYGPEHALTAATAYLQGHPMPLPALDGERRAREDHLSDLRDRALILLMAQMGLRADEVKHTPRAALTGDPPVLRVVGKGQRVRTLAVTPLVMVALEMLALKLKDLIAHQLRYHNSSRAEQLLDPSAPLIPAIVHWGKNAKPGRPLEGLERSAIKMMLMRRAEQVGITDKESLDRLHAHGLRHLFAHQAIAAATPVNRVQGMMGHSSGTTTMRYMDSLLPADLISQAHAPLPRVGETAAPARADVPAAGVQLPPPRAIPMAQVQAERPPRPRPPAPRPPPPPLPPSAPPPAPGARPARRRMVEVEPVVQPIIGLGELPPHPDGDDEDEIEVVGPAHAPPERERLAQAGAIAQVEQIYLHRWGEQGQRELLKATQGFGTAREYAEAAGRGYDADEPLAHTYVGRDSGLVWWAGPSGKLKPAMPILSPGQLGLCGPGEQSTLCVLLSELYAQVYDDRGPTAAQALVGWLRDGLRHGAAVDEEVARRGGGWVPAAAPWADTQSQKGKPRLVFREHLPAAIVGWLAERAQTYRRSVGAAKPIDTDYTPPSYYALPDPLVELADQDRSDALDWFSALTGQRIMDAKPRYEHGASRAELAQLVSDMCAYDQQQEIKSMLARDGSLKRGSREANDMARAITKAAYRVDQAVRTLGGPADFSIVEASAERVRARKLADLASKKGKETERQEDHGRDGHGREDDEGPKRVYRDTFYLKTLGDLFGPAAAADPVLKLVALCGRTPLGIEPYKSLFRIDHRLGTISHTRAFAEEFAKETGQHSECVARRVARDLWEMARDDKHARLLDERPDELLQYVDRALAYKIPCPEEQEGELRLRLKTRTPQPIYEAWARAQMATGTAASEAEAELDELGRAPEWGLGRGSAATRSFAGAGAARTYAGSAEDKYGKNPGQLRAAKRYLPSVVGLLGALGTLGRWAGTSAAPGSRTRTSRF